MLSKEMSARPDRRRKLAAAGAAVGLASALLAGQPAGEDADAAPIAGAAGGGTTIASATFTLAQPNETPRKTVLCPRHTFPYGGGMTSTPPPDPDGEGVYPHSYERLGVQGGWHVTPVLYDPSPGRTTPRKVTLQVVCGPEPGRLTPPHLTAQVNPGETKTHVLKCPGRRQLIGGGFQRTDFINRGGNFVTEFRAIASDTWRVTGTAFGGFGGELTGIAYCRRSGKPLLEERSEATTIEPGAVGEATTPRCPPGRRLVFGGFHTEPSGSVFISDGTFNGNQSFTGSGYNRSDGQATLKVHGYCLKVRPIL